MRRTQSQSYSDPGLARRLEDLTAAFAAYRRASRPGQRVPQGLRAQVVAALRAGVPAGAIERRCRLSWSQLTRWQASARAGEMAPAAPPPAQVLSVVDSPPAADGCVELRVGWWRIRLSRASESERDRVARRQ